jgi:hypothetical protein
VAPVCMCVCVRMTARIPKHTTLLPRSGRSLASLGEATLASGWRLLLRSSSAFAPVSKVQDRFHVQQLLRSILGSAGLPSFDLALDATSSNVSPTRIHLFVQCFVSRPRKHHEHRCTDGTLSTRRGYLKTFTLTLMKQLSTQDAVWKTGHQKNVNRYVNATS